MYTQLFEILKLVLKNIRVESLSNLIKFKELFDTNFKINSRLNLNF